MANGKIAAAVLFLTLLVAGRPLEGGVTVRTVSITRKPIPLDIRQEGAALLSVRILNAPEEPEIREARAHHPDRESTTVWSFMAENRDNRDYRAFIRVEILARSGRRVVRTCDKRETLDAGRRQEVIRLGCRARIIDLADAPAARITVEFTPK
jgi:hypothetical protein